MFLKTCKQGKYFLQVLLPTLRVIKATTQCQWRNWRGGRVARRPPGKLNVKNGPPLGI